MFKWFLAVSCHWGTEERGWPTFLHMNNYLIINSYWLIAAAALVSGGAPHTWSCSCWRDSDVHLRGRAEEVDSVRAEFGSCSCGKEATCEIQGWTWGTAGRRTHVRAYCQDKGVALFQFIGVDKDTLRSTCGSDSLPMRSERMSRRILDASLRVNSELSVCDQTTHNGC